jgi:hypothetical protein
VSDEPRGSPLSLTVAVRPLQTREDHVQQVGERSCRRRPVEETRHSAEQIAEQVARPGHRIDDEVNRVEMDRQTQQVQVDRLQLQVQDRAIALLA